MPNSASSATVRAITIASLSYGAEPGRGTTSPKELSSATVFATTSASPSKCDDPGRGDTSP